MSAPKTLDSIIGNARAVSALKIAVDAAKIEDRLPGHILLFGPSGVGKTTLANAVGQEFSGNFFRIHGPSISKKNINDFIKSFLMMEDRDTLFIDEVHALPKEAMEGLLEAMEESQISLLNTGENGQSSAMTIKISNILIIAATTRPNALLEPFKMRFGREVQLELYTDEELVKILSFEERPEKFAFTRNDLLEIAKRARGKARNALRYTNVVCDHVAVSNITPQEAIKLAFTELGIGEFGDTSEDRLYIKTLSNVLGGKPAGLNSIISASGLTKDDVESTVEPFLIGLGAVYKTKAGRQLNANHPLVLETLGA